MIVFVSGNIPFTGAKIKDSLSHKVSNTFEIKGRGSTQAVTLKS